MGDALNLANMLQTIRKCLQVWNMWSLSKAFIKYNHMDHKIRNGKVGMGENKCTKRGCGFENSWSQWKSNSPIRWFMFDEALEF